MITKIIIKSNNKIQIQIIILQIQLGRVFKNKMKRITGLYSHYKLFNNSKKKKKNRIPFPTFFFFCLLYNYTRINVYTYTCNIIYYAYV